LLLQAVGGAVVDGDDTDDEGEAVGVATGGSGSGVRQDAYDAARRGGAAPTSAAREASGAAARLRESVGYRLLAKAR
jgi:hypothetical protein